MRRSIKQQLLYPLRESTRYGCSKRADRFNNVDTNYYIYSLNSFKSLKHMAQIFAEFLKDNYPELKYVKELTSEHIEGFLNSRDVKPTVHYNYSYKLKKLLTINNKFYGNICTVNLDRPKVSKTEIRNNYPLSYKDFYILNEKVLDSKSDIKYIPLITYTIGTRLEEAISIKPEEIDLKARLVNLTNCKNGKKRQVPISKVYYKFWELLKRHCIEHNWKTVANNYSYETCLSFLNRCKKKVNLNKPKYGQTNHAIRKLYANRRLGEELENCKDLRAAWGRVQVELGHGPVLRKELFLAYIGQSFDSCKKELERID